MEYKVLKNRSGKFCPRVVTELTGETGCWFNDPYEYDNLEDAIKALREYKNDKNDKEEFVFTL